MVLAGSYALAEYVRERDLAKGHVYPSIDEMREVSQHVATRVIQQAFDDGVARTTGTTRDGAAEYVRAKAWWPRYLPFEKA
jgi:malate dehydrogenase (oxaloacetate-decarboxylating)